MTGTIANATDKKLTVEQWLEIRKEAGLRINPETAEVTWWYAQVLDPYGVTGVPKEYDQVGRDYFARSPGSDIWVWFGDLPDETRSKLWDRYQSKLAFPAGLFAEDTEDLENMVVRPVGE